MIYKLIVGALFVGSSDAFSFAAPSRPTLMQARAQPTMEVASAPAGPLSADVWDANRASTKRVEGETLATWDVGSPAIERVQLSLKSDGRPIHSNIEVWTTPSYIPCKFKVYTEDGARRPVEAILETPVSPKTVAVYNNGMMDFPISANVANTGSGKAYESFGGVEATLVQGQGTIKSFMFGQEVDSVAVLLKTEERNMKAKIELTQGPNQVKQIIELYCSKGYKYPMYFVIQTPGGDNAIRIINENTVEFPFDAYVVPYETAGEANSDPVMSAF